LGQRVIIKTRNGDVVGVIGAKPPHLLPPDERKKVVEIKTMFIDIGASSKEEVEEAGIRQGDPVFPRADFVELAGGKTYMSKAFDDRVGVAMMVNALQEFKKKEHPNTIYGVATVQEEIGLRGATTSVRAVDPDVAIVLEIDIAGDIPGITGEQSSVKLGKGPAMSIYDVRMVPNLKLRDLVRDTAETLDIPLQLSFMQGGATDGGAIHLHNTGVPTVVLGVPTRHIHSDSSIIHRDDFDHAVKLLVALITKLDAEQVKALTA
jgi:endoglucanase